MIRVVLYHLHGRRWCRPEARKKPAMTYSAQEVRHSLIAFLAAVPATAVLVWATYGLANFVV
jgi:hypothetical protein